MFETSIKHEGEFGSTNVVKMCVQVAFIIAGSTHAVYYKTLKHTLGIEAVGEHGYNLLYVSCCKIDAYVSTVPISAGQSRIWGPCPAVPNSSFTILIFCAEIIRWARPS